VDLEWEWEGDLKADAQPVEPIIQALQSVIMTTRRMAFIIPYAFACIIF
jgi:hypothetical protein